MEAMESVQSTRKTDEKWLELMKERSKTNFSFVKNSVPREFNSRRMRRSKP